MEEVQTAKRKQDDDIGNNAKKRTRTSKDVENPTNNSINRMDEAFLRFPHLPEQILEELDFESLANSRVVAKSWKEFIDEREHRWYPFKDEIADLKKQCRYRRTPFHLACFNGQACIAEIIMKNSANINIELNTKNNYGTTAFHLAGIYGQKSIVDMMINNSEFLFEQKNE